MRTRREWLGQVGAATVSGVGTYTSVKGDAIVIDPQPLFTISPHLYMQFMEPLGVTDSSVEASWDYTRDDWRADFVETVRDLSPGMLRFGGNFSRYYKWREGVGPVARRPWMRNYDWGGKETNRVGTHEFVDFCRRVKAEPLYCVNFEGDGIASFKHTPEGDRTGVAKEAADWVSYANDPDNRERKANGAAAPLNIKYWQIGNETSYVADAFDRKSAIAKTIEFAKSMRGRDRSLQLIGWGDQDRGSHRLWAEDMLEQAGEHLDLIAIHMMGQSPKRPDTVLNSLRYEQAPEQAWAELIELSNNVERRIAELDEVIAARKPAAGIAVTEGHLSLKPHNANPILTEWLSAVYHARSLNIYQRHGARVKIAACADFQGSRWTVMAVALPVPKGRAYLLPAGSVARLFARHNGRQAISVAAPSNLDISASRTGNKIYLHVASLEYARPVFAAMAVKGMRLTGGRLYEIAPGEPREYVNQDRPDIFKPIERALAAAELERIRIAARSVCVIELDVEQIKT